MKYLIGLFFIFFIYGFMTGQDLDIYKYQKNSNFELPAIPKEMTYEEFKILSTDLRMQDMMIATVFPGHIHFKIGEKKKGYYILGTRSLGYLGWGYLSVSNKSMTRIIMLDATGLDQTLNARDVIIAYGSLGLILGSYLYDWIHGKYTLEDKQTRIRYKYAPKRFEFGLNIIKTPGYQYPGLMLAFNF